MNQTRHLLVQLKTALRQRNLEYRDVAAHLQLSESSVKRLFSQGGFTLERLEAVCDLAEIDFTELVLRAERDTQRLVALTADQEREVIADPALLLIAICALNHWRFVDIQHNYAFTEPELIGHLVRLDRLGLLELLPNNRIKLRIARNFAWLPNGPIQRFFVDRVQDEFLASNFSSSADTYRFTWGMLSAESARVVQQKIAELITAFDSHASADEARRMGGSNGTCMLVAFREGWEPASFAQMRQEA